jgi:hypothetical protein
MRKCYKVLEKELGKSGIWRSEAISVGIDAMGVYAIHCANGVAGLIIGNFNLTGIISSPNFRWVWRQKMVQMARIIAHRDVRPCHSNWIEKGSTRSSSGFCDQTYTFTFRESDRHLWLVLNRGFSFL